MSCTPTSRNRKLLAELNKVRVVETLTPIIVKRRPMTVQQLQNQFKTTGSTNLHTCRVDTVKKTISYEDESFIPDNDNSNIAQENSPLENILIDFNVEEDCEDSINGSEPSDDEVFPETSLTSNKRDLAENDDRFSNIRKRLKSTEMPLTDVTNSTYLHSSQQFKSLVNEEKGGHSGICCDACNNKIDLVLEKLNENNELLKELIKHKNPGGLNNNSHPALSMLPCNDLENLLDFDDSLQNDGKIEEQLRQKLMTLGGKTLHNAVDRAVSTILTNEICKSVSWSGTSGSKKVLMVKAMNFPKIVQDVVQFKTGDDADAVEGKIKDWLRRSSDRMRGKSASSAN